MSTPHMEERSPGIVELIVRSRPVVSQYRFVASNTLDGAFAAPTTMFTIPSNTWYRSPSLQKSSLSRNDTVYRGLTVAQINFDDFASATIHGDNAINFVRLAELDSAGNVLNIGPILVVPPPFFYTTPNRVLFLSGTAPDVPSLGTGLPPVGAMVIALPRRGEGLVLVNTDGAETLYVSLGEGMPETAVAPNGQLPINSTGGVGSDLFLHGDGGTPTFTLSVNVVSGFR
jgi:hypothetical protein